MWEQEIGRENDGGAEMVNEDKSPENKTNDQLICKYVAFQWCLTLCWPHGLYSTLGSSVIHCLPEFAQICVHWVSDAYANDILLLTQCHYVCRFLIDKFWAHITQVGH